MNRIDLLKRVAEVAPEWMGAYYFHDELEHLRGDNAEHSAVFRVGMFNVSLYLKDDFEDSKAIVAMLDAMEKEGHICVLTRLCEETTEGGYFNPQPNPYCPGALTSRHKRIPKDYVLQILTSGCGSKEVACGIGETRAEAVALAFVAVFGGKE